MCAAKGYELVLTLPQGMSRERESLLRLYGARVEVTESMGGMNEAVAGGAGDGAATTTCSCPTSSPTRPIRRSTADTPARRSSGRWTASVDVLVAGVGTGGTITGVGEYLRERNPKLRVVAVEPRGSAVLSGEPPGPHRIQGIGAGFVPAVLNRELLDEVIARRRRGRDRDGAGVRETRGRARGHLVRRGAVGGARGGAAAGVDGQADRRDPAGLGRALRLASILRPVS